MLEGFIKPQDVFKAFEELLHSCEHQLLIVSPYVTQQAVNVLVEYLAERDIACTVVTRYPGNDYIIGATDPHALATLYECGVILKCLERLHAKLYVADGTRALFGSGNLTDPGLGIKQSGRNNIELMYSKTLSEDEYRTLKSFYMSCAIELRPTKDWADAVIESVKGVQQDLNHLGNELRDLLREPVAQDDNPYFYILDMLCERGDIVTYERKYKGFGHNTFLIDGKHLIKMFYSADRKSPDGYFSYNISGATRDNIVERKFVSVVLITSTREFAWFPATFFATNLLTTSKRKSGNTWQMQFSPRSVALQISARKKTRFNVALCMDKVRYRYTPELKKELRPLKISQSR